MLHIIGGLDNPTSGQVIVDGQNLSHMTDEEITISDAGILVSYFNSITWFRC